MNKRRRERRAALRMAAADALPPNVTPITSRSPPVGEVGVSGTRNERGTLYVESNAALNHERAFGDPWSADWGEWERLERTDHAVAAALNLIAAPLRDATVDIEPGADDERAIAIADFVRDNMQEWLEPRWPTLVEQVVKGGLAYGFSLHEIVTDTRPDARVPGGRAVYVKRLAQRLPSSVKSDGWLEADGPNGRDLVAIKQHGVRDGRWQQDIDLPADKVVLATWNRTGNNYVGFPAFRPVWYLGKLRAELLKILAIGHARESLGIPTVKRDASAGSWSKAQVDALATTLAGLTYHESAHIVLPPGAELTWVFSPGANKSSVLESWKGLGLAILETVQQQQMYLGTSDTGSRAVGEVHERGGNAFVRGVSAWFEATLNGIGAQPYTGLVRKLVDWNFGPQQRYPMLRLVEKKDDVAPGVELAQAIKLLSDAGALNLMLKDENTLRERYGLDLVDQAEVDALNAPVLPATGGQAPGEGAGPGVVTPSPVPAPVPLRSSEVPGPTAVLIGGDAPRPAGDGGGTSGALNWPHRHETLAEYHRRTHGFDFHDAHIRNFAAPRGAWTPTRPLRPEETHLALADIDAFHTSARDEFERDARELVHDMLDRAVPAIRQAMADGDPSELSSLTLNTAELARYATAFVEKARSFGYRQAMREKRSQPTGLLAKRADGDPGIKPMTPGVALAAFERRWRFADPPDGDDKRTPRPPPPPPPGAAAAVPVDRLVKAQADLAVARVAARLRALVLDEAVDSVRRKESAEVVLKNVTEVIDETATLRTDAGLLTARSFAIGRDQFWAEAAEDIDHMVYSAVLDTATCGPCQSQDGTEVRYGDADYDALTPPLKDCVGGGNCRCLLVGVWK